MPDEVNNAPRPTLLVVDDEPVNLSLLNSLLRGPYNVRAATSGAIALQVAQVEPLPDLVLLDIMMPDMDGHEVLKRLRADPVTHDIPVIFITALAHASDEEFGLDLGAADYITKPIQPAVLLARVRTQLDAKRARDWMRDQNAFLEAEVDRRMADNDASQRVGIRALAHLAEARDPETGDHILRTQTYVNKLATRLARLPAYASQLDARTIDLLTRSAPLHDIGKVGIPDHILRKSGALTADEWAVMKTHSMRGYEAIVQAEADVDRPVAFLTLAKEIARWHHERWDGSGYPDGLAGEAIPLSARIMALADVFDALATPRAYKPVMPLDEVKQAIVNGRGSHFEPALVDLFIAHFDTFAQIADGFRAGHLGWGNGVVGPDSAWADL